MEPAALSHTGTLCARHGQKGAVRKARNPGTVVLMDARLIQIFGPKFVVDDIRDLELLTDLLAISRDHLNVVLAVASYLEQVPNGADHFRPVLRTRLQSSLAQLGCPARSATAPAKH